jgi:hypothetical protein
MSQRYWTTTSPSATPRSPARSGGCRVQEEALLTSSQFTGGGEGRAHATIDHVMSQRALAASRAKGCRRLPVLHGQVVRALATQVLVVASQRRSSRQPLSAELELDEHEPRCMCPRRCQRLTSARATQTHSTLVTPLGASEVAPAQKTLMRSAQRPWQACPRLGKARGVRRLIADEIVVECTARFELRIARVTE